MAYANASRIFSASADVHVYPIYIKRELHSVLTINSGN